MLQRIQSAVLERGGETWYNNNIDLYAVVGDSRMLIEAKSLTDPRAAVDRMRYGIGQLSDYDFRYRPQLGNPVRVLAFGAAPPSDAAWIGSVLEDQRIAFLAQETNALVPLNDSARRLPLF